MASVSSSENPTADAKALPDLTFSDFELIEKIGEGGMGTVYRARQRSLDRDVALKLLPPALAGDPDFVDRFYREARLSARLDHPNIVRGIAVGEEAGVHYLAMELVDGESTDLILERRGHFGVSEAVGICIQVADALEFAHRHGLVHRDVKPANIIVTSDGRVKLADLGLIKMEDDEKTLSRAGDTLGTPPYMAPEQIRNARDAGPASDVYALGATLFRMLTGSKPFSGNSLIEILAAKEAGSFCAASQRNPEVPALLDEILGRMMAPDSQRRFVDATEVKAALESVVPSLGEDRPAPAMRLYDRDWLSKASTLVVGFLVVITLFGLTQFLSLQWFRVEPGGRPAEIVASAYDALGAGRLFHSKQILEDGRTRYPSDDRLRRSLSEIETGVLVLMQLSQPGQSTRWISPWSHYGQTLSSRDNYRFAIAAAKDCFVYSYQVDAHGSVQRLFPSDFSHARNPLNSGVIYWVPDSDTPEPSWLYLDDRKGRERIVFLAVQTPLPNVTSVEQLLRDTALKSVSESVESLQQAADLRNNTCYATKVVQVFEFSHR